MSKDEISDWFLQLQSAICASLEQADGKAKFMEDSWKRDGGGGGVTRVLQDGNVIEKGGVNFSEVYGKTPEKIAKGLKIDESDFYATGVSIVMHPSSPMVPIIHMNVRYFEMTNGLWWFGGGIDLTPHYVNEEDASFFHKKLLTVCNQHHPSYYNDFKKWADDYFFIKHRNETRGIGGIFFDRLSETDVFTKEDRFAFVKDVGTSFAPIYTHFMNKNRLITYGEQEISWQKLRRGRYTEFNLVWDIGTKFGLETNGRIESILMSLPPEANWVYNHKVQAGSEEEKTLSFLRKGIDWVS